MRFVSGRGDAGAKRGCKIHPQNIGQKFSGGLRFNMVGMEVSQKVWGYRRASARVLRNPWEAWHVDSEIDCGF
jgi:hypothetical protein